MRHVVLSVAKGLAKLFCVLMAPVISVFNTIYKIAAQILSYGLIGLSLLCLLAIAAELLNYGITKEAIAYFSLAAISYVVRWALLWSLGIMDIVCNTVKVIADPSVTVFNDFALEP